jgi:hypothetical protein
VYLEMDILRQNGRAIRPSTPFHLILIYRIYGNVSPFGQQAKVIQGHKNGNVSDVEKGIDRHRKYKELRLGGG